MSTSNIKPIIFYDYDGTKSPTRAWSNDSWRGRFALNMNGVPHETEWLEYGQVEKATSAVGVPANGTRFLEGTPLYTLPAIKDPNTDAAIVDSKKIAQYIAKQYPNPNAPDLFPEGTEELQTKFRDEFNTRVHYPIMLLNIYRAGQQINPRSWPFFRPAREAMFKSKLEDIAPDGSEKKAKHVQEVLEGLVYTGEWIDRENKERGTNGPFLFGDKPSFADVDVAACLLYLYIMHKDDGEGGAWDTIAKAEGGRWDRYLHEFDNWREVH